MGVLGIGVKVHDKHLGAYADDAHKLLELDGFLEVHSGIARRIVGGDQFLFVVDLLNALPAAAGLGFEEAGITDIFSDLVEVDGIMVAVEEIGDGIIDDTFVIADGEGVGFGDIETEAGDVAVGGIFIHGEKGGNVIEHIDALSKHHKVAGGVGIPMDIAVEDDAIGALFALELVGASAKPLDLDFVDLIAPRDSRRDVFHQPLEGGRERVVIQIDHTNSRINPLHQSSSALRGHPPRFHNVCCRVVTEMPSASSALG